MDELSKDIDKSAKAREEDAKELIDSSSERTDELVKEGKDSTKKNVDKANEITDLNIDDAKKTMAKNGELEDGLLKTNAAGQKQFKKQLEVLDANSEKMVKRARSGRSIAQKQKETIASGAAGTSSSLQEKVQVLQHLVQQGMTGEQAIATLQEKGIDVSDVMQLVQQKQSQMQGQLAITYAAAASNSPSLQDKIQYLQNAVSQGYNVEDVLIQMQSNGIPIEDVIAYIKQASGMAETVYQNGAPVTAQSLTGRRGQDPSTGSSSKARMQNPSMQVPAQTPQLPRQSNPMLIQ